jgi:hypothetical protein
VIPIHAPATSSTAPSRAQHGSFAGTTIKDGPDEVEQLGRSFVILGQVGQPGVDRQPNSDGDVAVSGTRDD